MAETHFHGGSSVSSMRYTFVTIFAIPVTVATDLCASVTLKRQIVSMDNFYQPMFSRFGRYLMQDLITSKQWFCVSVCQAFPGLANEMCAPGFLRRHILGNDITACYLRPV